MGLGRYELEAVAATLLNKYIDFGTPFAEPMDMGNCQDMVRDGWFEQHRPDDGDRYWYTPTDKLLKKLWEFCGKQDEYEMHTVLVPKTVVTKQPVNILFNVVNL